MRPFITPATRALRRGAVLSALSGGAAFAQTTPPDPATQTIPGLDGFSLPASRSAPRATPAPSPTTRPRDTPAANPTARATPAATLAPASRTPPAPTVRPTPTPTPTPDRIVPPPALPTVVPTPRALRLADTAVPLPGPTQAPSPIVIPPEPAPRPAPERSGNVWSLFDPVALAALALIAVLLAVFGLGWWWRNRPVRERAERRHDARHEVFALGVDTPAGLPPPAAAPPAAAPPAPVPTPAPAAPPSVGAVERAMLEIDLTLKRAGTNLLSASVEYALAVRNTGTQAATGVRLDLRMLSAGPDQDAILAGLFAQGVERPITPSFDLLPGDTLLLDGMAMHPKETLVLLDMVGPALFVPVVAVVARYGWNGGEGRTARAWVVGMVRGEGTRLQPFRRDGARMFETVAVLDYSIVLDG